MRVEEESAATSANNLALGSCGEEVTRVDSGGGNEGVQYTLG